VSIIFYLIKIKFILFKNKFLTDANEKRSEINSQVEIVLDKETKSYGVEELRVEI